MKEAGIVVETGKKGAVVMVDKKSSGKSCDSCSLCRRGKNGKMFLEIPDSKGARKGDRVTVEVDEKGVLRGIFFIYAVPLAGFILAAVLSSMAATFYLGAILFISVFAAAWSYGLAKANAEGEKNKTRIVSKGG